MAGSDSGRERQRRDTAGRRGRQEVHPDHDDERQGDQEDRGIADQALAEDRRLGHLAGGLGRLGDLGGLRCLDLGRDRGGCRGDGRGGHAGRYGRGGHDGRGLAGGRAGHHDPCRAMGEGLPLEVDRGCRGDGRHGYRPAFRCRTAETRRAGEAGHDLGLAERADGLAGRGGCRSPGQAPEQVHADRPLDDPREAPGLLPRLRSSGRGRHGARLGGRHGPGRHRRRGGGGGGGHDGHAGRRRRRRWRPDDDRRHGRRSLGGSASASRSPASISASRAPPSADRPRPCPRSGAVRRRRRRRQRRRPR